jgi:hypothetical protein
MSSIGTFTFMRMEGPQIPQLAAAVEIIDRPGTDGIASRVNALKAEELTENTIEGVSTLTIAQTRADYYAAYKGTCKTVIDDIGREVDNVLIVDVRVIKVQKVLTASLAGVNYLIYAVWLLRPTQS